MAKNEDGYEKYLGYIEDSLDEVAEKVTRIFDERKKGLAATLCGMLRDAASCATHYEWRRGDCPYDTSGELKDCGDIDLNISIADFLEEEYTGGTKATYVSGHGLSYETYQDSLTNDTITLCENVLRDAVRICLQEAFPEDEVSERDAEEVIYECHDDIYDNCPAESFWPCSGALEYCGIDTEMPLKSLFDTKKEKIVAFKTK